MVDYLKLSNLHSTTSLPAAETAVGCAAVAAAVCHCCKPSAVPAVAAVSGAGAAAGVAAVGAKLDSGTDVAAAADTPGE